MHSSFHNVWKTFSKLVFQHFQEIGEYLLFLDIWFSEENVSMPKGKLD